MKKVNNYEEWSINEDLKFLSADEIKKKASQIKTGLKNLFNKNKHRAEVLSVNLKTAAEDLTTGKIFKDEDSAENLKDTLTDVLKLSGQGALFALPGGSLALPMLLKALKTDAAKKLGLEHLLDLSFETLEAESFSGDKDYVKLEKKETDDTV